MWIALMLQLKLTTEEHILHALIHMTAISCLILKHNSNLPEWPLQEDGLSESISGLMTALGLNHSGV